jgi:alpha-methylacyl-CoA racemase
MPWHAACWKTRMENAKTPKTSAGSTPLAGIRVIDFSTLLPGPMCSLILARAGAEVIKVERPGRGDEMRTYEPKFGSHSVNFALLNQGKRSVALDLKDPSDVQRAIDLVQSADVVIEQFRPGVMERLGLGYKALHAINPGLIYCSITGWGQDGPLANVAAHDLNYQAEAGIVGLTAGTDGTPLLPSLLSADIAGGAYPAVMNILLALRSRETAGQGCMLDIAMADNLFTFNYWGLGNGFSAGLWPEAGRELLTGGTPRYQVYRTKDDRFLAAAPLEQKFWENFLGVIAAPELLDDSKDPQNVCKAVAAIILTRTAEDWMKKFSEVDACVSVVKSLREAVESPHFKARGLFSEQISDGSGGEIPALPLPVAASFLHGSACPAPALGEADPKSLHQAS